MANKSRLSPLYAHAYICMCTWYAYTHVHMYAFTHATLPECESGLQHSAESRPHEHYFILRDKTTPTRTNNSDELSEEQHGIIEKELNIDALKTKFKLLAILTDSSINNIYLHSAGCWKFSFERRSSHPQGCQSGRGNVQ